MVTKPRNAGQSRSGFNIGFGISRWRAYAPPVGWSKAWQFFARSRKPTPITVQRCGLSAQVGGFPSIRGPVLPGPLTSIGVMPQSISCEKQRASVATPALYMIALVGSGPQTTDRIRTTSKARNAEESSWKV
jgi:hypothetical protein